MKQGNRVVVTGPSGWLSRNRASLGIVMKLAVSGGLIAYILLAQVENVGEIWRAIAGADPWLLLGAFLLHIFGYILCSWRWQILLAAQGFVVPVLELARAYTVGIFFNAFLPGVMSGDFMRALDISDRVPSYAQSLTILFVERITGMIALLLIGLLALPFIDFQIVKETGVLWALLAVSVLVAALSTFFLSDRARQIMNRVGLMTRLRPLSAAIAKITQTAAVFSGRIRPVIVCIAISLVFQVNVVLHFYLIAEALGFDVPLVMYFAIIPVSLFIMMIPVSINGVGVREQIFILLFGYFGVPASSAISLAWIALVFMLVQAIAGGVIFGLRRKTAPA